MTIDTEGSRFYVLKARTENGEVAKVMLMKNEE
jgi:hypothetical protein